MNRFPVNVPEDDSLVSPTSPLYICVSPPQGTSETVVLGSPTGWNNSDALSTRFLPPSRNNTDVLSTMFPPMGRNNTNSLFRRFPPAGRSRYHSWNPGNAYAIRNQTSGLPFPKNLDSDVPVSMCRSTSLSPVAPHRGFRTTSVSPYERRGFQPDHRFRYNSCGASLTTDAQLTGEIKKGHASV